ncbi:MAG: pilus assembly protein PilM [Planctomycetes bacterium]|nr:pilus assembly protein PilM [Planctomycetota bacterium]
MALFGKNRSLVGLDIGSSSVKALELTRSGSSLMITGMGSAPVEGPEGVADAIQRVLRESGIKSKRCVSSVSGRSVIIRQVPMAEMPDHELRQAVEYEADKYIPFDVNEVQLDAQRLKDGDGVAAGQMKVLLVAVKKSLIEEHIALLQSVGLTPAIIDVDVFALGNAFELRNLSLGIQDNEVRALVDIGGSKTNINIMRGNISYFQREIYVAGNDLTEAIAKRFGEDPADVEKMKKDPGGALESMQDAMLPVLEDIGSEIRLSFDYYENQYDEQVKEVYVSGGSVYFPGVDTMLTQIFNLPTKIWDPTEGMEMSGFSPASLGGANSDMVISMGLASRLISGLKGATVTAAPRMTTTVGDDGMPVTMPEAAPISSGEVQKAWIKGIAIGTAASVASAALVAIANSAGYSQWWAVGEGLPLGILAGWGIWQGINVIRPAPGRVQFVMAALLVTLLSCGGLLGFRITRGDPISASSKPEGVKAPPKPPNERSFLPKEGMTAGGEEGKRMQQAEEELKARQEKMAEENRNKSKFSINDVSALLRILSHWLLAAFCAVMFLNVKVNKAVSGRR